MFHTHPLSPKSICLSIILLYDVRRATDHITKRLKAFEEACVGRRYVSICGILYWLFKMQLIMDCILYPLEETIGVMYCIYEKAPSYSMYVNKQRF